MRRRIDIQTRIDTPPGGAGRWLWFTGIFLGLLIAANLAAIAFLPGGQADAVQRFGISLEALLHGEVWRLITASLLTHDMGMFIRQVIFAALVIGTYEWQNGSRRAATVFWATDIVGTALLFLLVVAPYDLMLADPSAAMGHIYDVGISGGAFGLLGAHVRDLFGRNRVSYETVRPRQSDPRSMPLFPKDRQMDLT